MLAHGRFLRRTTSCLFDPAGAMKLTRYAMTHNIVKPAAPDELASKIFYSVAGTVDRRYKKRRKASLMQTG
jgi:hypothetical protein